MLHFLKYWLPPLLMMALIFLISTDLGSAAHTSSIIEPVLRYLFPKISEETIDQVHHIFRKGGHLTGYAILGILWWRALMHRLSARASRSPGGNAAVALIISAAYAASDEYHQSFIPTRTASVHDVMIDTCGALVGLALALMWYVWRIRLARRA
jgi:VanZ family protein